MPLSFHPMIKWNRVSALGPNGEVAFVFWGIRFDTEIGNPVLGRFVPYSGSDLGDRAGRSRRSRRRAWHPHIISPNDSYPPGNQEHFRAALLFRVTLRVTQSTELNCCSERRCPRDSCDSVPEDPSGPAL